MQSYEKMSKDALELLMDVVEELDKIDPNFDLNKLRVFLSVALQNGIEAQTLVDKYKIPKATIGYTVAVLAPQGWRHSTGEKAIKGLGLIVQEPSPRDARAKALRLSFAGKQLVDRLTQIIFEKRKGEDSA